MAFQFLSYKRRNDFAEWGSGILPEETLGSILIFVTSRCMVLLPKLLGLLHEVIPQGSLITVYPGQQMYCNLRLHSQNYIQHFLYGSMGTVLMTFTISYDKRGIKKFIRGLCESWSCLLNYLKFCPYFPKLDLIKLVLMCRKQDHTILKNVDFYIVNGFSAPMQFFGPNF